MSKITFETFLVKFLGIQGGKVDWAETKYWLSCSRRTIIGITDRRRRHCRWATIGVNFFNKNLWLTKGEIFSPKSRRFEFIKIWHLSIELLQRGRHRQWDQIWRNGGTLAGKSLGNFLECLLEFGIILNLLWENLLCSLAKFSLLQMFKYSKINFPSGHTFSAQFFDFIYDPKTQKYFLS